MGRTNDDVARTRMLWVANKPGDAAAPAYVPDPPAAWQIGLALAIALLVQSSLAPFVGFRGATPSLVTLLVAWYAIRTGTLGGLVFGMIAGACEDAFAGDTGAAWTFATALVGTLCGRLARTPLAETRLVLVPAAGVVTFVRFCAFASVMTFEGRGLALPAVHVRAALWQSLLDALVALVLLRAFPRLGGSNANRR